MQDVEEKARQYFESMPNVITVYIFGSFARQKMNRFSDIDIAVLVGDGIEESSYTDIQLKFMKDLASVFEKEVDVVILNRASPFLKYQIFRYGKRVFEGDVKRSRSFKAKSIFEYFDFKPVKDFAEKAKIELLKGTSHG